MPASVEDAEILPAIDAAAAAGVPILGHDRMIEDERAFHLTFDNVGLGGIIAAIVRQGAAGRQCAIIMADASDPNVAFPVAVLF